MSDGNIVRVPHILKRCGMKPYAAVGLLPEGKYISGAPHLVEMWDETLCLQYHSPMPRNLVRYQATKTDLHFLTFSCHQRRPYFATPASRDLFEQSLESMRLRYGFFVTGYVVMPEHVHLLVSEPPHLPLSRAIQALKLSVAVQLPQRPFWQPRYYDFNVYSEKKTVEKLRYMHRNPVARGLVPKPSDWLWSSFRHYLNGDIGCVEIESEWTALRRARARD